jgi:hypothetical protein
MKSTTTA